MAQTAGLDPENKVKVNFDCRMFDIANWVANINRENGSRGSPSHETFSVALQRELDISSVAGQNLLPWSETISAHLDWWQSQLNVPKGLDLHHKNHSIQISNVD